mmetsp:Transcript_39427/g.124416  ORF Transcript_39427/g.124416 Transcript_39427/m.124416 type:complete len:305 (+) Transcript_39427:1182-2096(+)
MAYLFSLSDVFVREMDRDDSGFNESGFKKVKCLSVSLARRPDKGQHTRTRQKPECRPPAARITRPLSQWHAQPWALRLEGMRPPLEAATPRGEEWTGVVSKVAAWTGEELTGVASKAAASKAAASMAAAWMALHSPAAQRRPWNPPRQPDTVERPPRPGPPRATSRRRTRLCRQPPDSAPAAPAAALGRRESPSPTLLQRPTRPSARLPPRAAPRPPQSSLPAASRLSRPRGRASAPRARRGAASRHSPLPAPLRRPRGAPPDRRPTRAAAPSRAPPRRRRSAPPKRPPRGRRRISPWRRRADP